MNSELINALISQIGNIVGIPLAAVLAVWQVKKGFTSKRNDEVNEKSFSLCCELFDLVSRNESYNKEVTDKICLQFNFTHAERKNLLSHFSLPDSRFF